MNKKNLKNKSYTIPKIYAEVIKYGINDWTLSKSCWIKDINDMHLLYLKSIISSYVIDYVDKPMRFARYYLNSTWFDSRYLVFDIKDRKNKELVVWFILELFIYILKLTIYHW